MAVHFVVRPEVPVMYVESAAGLAGAAEAFRQLEARLPGLKRRRFYGTFQPPDGPYRACVAREPGDDPPALGLATWTIPGGKYGRGKLANWEAQIPVSATGAGRASNSTGASASWSSCSRSGRVRRVRAPERGSRARRSSRRPCS